MAGSNDMRQMYKSVDPKWPSCEGIHHGNSGENDYFDVSYDQFNNERSEDRPMHGNTTAAMGSTHYNGNQYANDFNAGYGSYGVSVEDNGRSPKVERTTVSVDRADRGKES
jgi:hypothetical protein